jgi:type VI secretion system protein ImpB
VRRIPELSTLLEARNRLKELLTYMDGKAAAEDLIHELLKNPQWSDEEAAVAEPAPTAGPSGDPESNQEVK